jgi:ribose transport system substrate-binding protein
MTCLVTRPSLRRHALLAAFVIEAACGSDRMGNDMTGPTTATGPPAAAPATAGKAKLRFAFLPRSLDQPSSNLAKVGADRAAATLGNVEILWRGPETVDPARQKEMLEAFITQKVDGIAVSCTNGELLTEAINKAVEAGIPVVTWGSDAPKSKRLAFYGIDDLASGKALGEETAKLVGDKGTVVVVTSLGAEDLHRRLEGVEEALKGHAGIKVVEVLDVKDDPARSVEVIAAATRKYPTLGAFVSIAGPVAFAPGALEPVDPARTRFVGFDTLAPALELMKAGKVQVLVGQKYFGWGSESVKILADVKAGKPPAQPVVDSGVDIVTPANLAQYQEARAKLEKP